MLFDINTGAGEWFPFFGSRIKQDGEIEYFDPEPGAGSVCLRIADPDVWEKIQSETRKKVSENVFNPKTRAMERIVYFDQTPAQERKEREMIWDHAIVGWKDILDANGKQIPCTLENKMKLINNPQFGRFVGRCLQLIGEAKEAAKVNEAKN